MNTAPAFSTQRKPLNERAARGRPPVGAPDVSVVVPTYNGHDSLRELTLRVAQTLDRMGLQWELLLVDDASPDNTLVLGPQLQEAHRQVRYVRLAHNVGQHRATVMGLELATGGVVVTMDDDLQQPPESIPRLLAALRPGVEVAIGRFDKSAHASWRRFASAAMALALHRQGATPALAITSFKAFTQGAAARVVAQVPEGHFYLARVIQATLPRAALVNVNVPHHRRVHGQSNYGLGRLLRMGWRALRGAVASRRPAE